MVLVLLGVGSRSSGVAGFSPLITKYLGDLLWATMFYVTLVLIWPAWSSNRTVGVAALLVSGVEFFKRYHVPWIDGLRSMRWIGSLLGTVFQWENFIAYALGLIVAIALDLAWLRRSSQEGVVIGARP